MLLGVLLRHNLFVLPVRVTSSNLPGADVGASLDGTSAAVTWPCSPAVGASKVAGASEEVGAAAVPMGAAAAAVATTAADAADAATAAGLDVGTAAVGTAADRGQGGAEKRSAAHLAGPAGGAALGGAATGMRHGAAGAAGAASAAGNGAAAGCAEAKPGGVADPSTASRHAGGSMPKLVQQMAHLRQLQSLHALAGVGGLGAGSAASWDSDGDFLVRRPSRNRHLRRGPQLTLFFLS